MKRAALVLLFVVLSGQRAVFHRWVLASECSGHLVFDVIYSDTVQIQTLQFHEYRDAAQALDLYNHIRAMRWQHVGLTTTNEGTFIVWWR